MKLLLTKPLPQITPGEEFRMDLAHGSVPLQLLVRVEQSPIVIGCGKARTANARLVLLYLADPTNVEVPRQFALATEGQAVPDTARYVATIQGPEGPLHLFEVENEP